MALLPCRLSRAYVKRERIEVYPTAFFEVGNFGNTEAMGVIFFWKCSKFKEDLKNAEKISEIIFCFWEKSIWIACIDFSLLIREYLSSTVNVLTKNLKTFHFTKSYFSNSITFRVINQYGEGAAVKIESVFWCDSHVACRAILSIGSF